MEWKQEVAERLVLLMEHYAIDPNDSDCWYALAQGLVRQHVPGFQEEGRGNQPKWTAELDNQLFDAVTKHRNNSARRACDLLAKRKPWSEIEKMTGGGMYKRYSEIKDDFEIIAAHHAQHGGRPWPAVPFRSFQTKDNYTISGVPFPSRIQAESMIRELLERETEKDS